MFEKASRLQLRIEYKGLCSVEDLWNLSLKELDSIFKKLNTELKACKEESLLATKSKEDEVLALKVEIVKHIVAVKLQEKESRENASLKASQKEKLLSIIAKKQDEGLNDLSIEELNKMAAEL